MKTFVIFVFALMASASARADGTAGMPAGVPGGQGMSASMQMGQTTSSAQPQDPSSAMQSVTQQRMPGMRARVQSQLQQGDSTAGAFGSGTRMPGGMGMGQ